VGTDVRDAPPELHAAAITIRSAIKTRIRPPCGTS
jgi:hypothetical protein